MGLSKATKLRPSTQDIASRLYGGLLDLLFPPRCAVCGAAEDWLCQECRGNLVRLEPPYCLRCAQPLPSEPGQGTARETQAHGLADREEKTPAIGWAGGQAPGAGPSCARCSLAPLAIDQIRAPFLMQGAAREMVHRLKYDGWRVLAKVLAAPLLEELRNSGLQPDVLVPVPLHPVRERQRGYNQAALLAEELGRLAGLATNERTLVRWRAAPPQARAASAQERRAAVADAYRCRDQRLQGYSVLLIDDVCTTGATLEACAVALRDGGAAQVWGLVVAREP